MAGSFDCIFPGAESSSESFLRHNINKEEKKKRKREEERYAGRGNRMFSKVLGKVFNIIMC